jgi:hypothetical protein
MAGKQAKPCAGEAKFHQALQAAASGAFSSELGSVEFIDIEKLTKGERKCGEVLSWLCQKQPSGDGSGMLPSSALPLLP